MENNRAAVLRSVTALSRDDHQRLCNEKKRTTSNETADNTANLSPYA
jgi:hypothetical protein